MKKKNPKVALVYDKLNTSYGGAENVLKALLEIWPEAPLFTSIHLPSKTAWVNLKRVKTSWLNSIPFLKHHFVFCAPLLPLTFESLDLSEFDIVISVTSGEAKGVLTTNDQLHICYLLTPPRYLYSHKKKYKKSLSLASLLVFSQIFDLLIRYQTWWDQAAAQRPDYIIPISDKIKKRAKKYYNFKTKKALYPPVSTSLKKEIIIDLPFNDFLLSTSRLVAYKRVDLAIKAALVTKQKLLIVGEGKEKNKLLRFAGRRGVDLSQTSDLVSAMKTSLAQKKHTIFLGNRTRREVASLLHHCKAFLLLGEEDFGIAPLEAATLGKPVIIHKNSGVAEILTEPIHGVHIEKETVEESVRAINIVSESHYNSQEIKADTLKYSTEAFKVKFAKNVLNLHDKFLKKK